ncbi:nuclear receptor subfamily 0 group B member 1-like isoform X1 [Scyliorhinus canicula]|uniref:nuclear receptor subfamily 0 group B member 1-like isoform X1 n=1 Tax=Scyliorhinus canicula TaxID=7830 RepID=UPI0018F6A169|nr:nuclear receptor subfamily 0 group B member 1-like isoform X1 [Scyliorhinus canicula]
MAFSSHSALQRRCHCEKDKMDHSSILYHILNRKRHLPTCSCKHESKEKVALGSPYVACKAASEVLLKTVNFIKNLPSFRGLLQPDQLLLLENCWAALFVLGLAQEGVDFEVIEPSRTSILKEILTNREGKGSDEKTITEPSAAEVQKVKSFLTKCWSIDISTKEYVYLKGIVLFSPVMKPYKHTVVKPWEQIAMDVNASSQASKNLGAVPHRSGQDVSGLHSPQYILGLQQEAERALTEYTHSAHLRDTSRFSQILFALTSLKSINAPVIAQLFFRPLIGNVQMNALLMEMLYTS